MYGYVVTVVMVVVHGLARRLVSWVLNFGWVKVVFGQD